MRQLIPKIALVNNESKKKLIFQGKDRRIRNEMKGHKLPASPHAHRQKLRERKTRTS